MSKFKENLLALRKAAGYSQEDFARLLQIPPKLLAMYEAGERQPMYSLLITIAELLGVSTDELLGKIPCEKAEIGEKFSRFYKEAMNFSRQIIQLNAQFLEVTKEIFEERS